MATAAGFSRRPDNAPAVLLQGRVAPEVREAVSDAARASRVTVSLYLELLLQGIVERDGHLPILKAPGAKKPEETLL